MEILHLNSYRDVLGNRNFLTFWMGFTVSTLGDSLTRVALTWLIFAETRSAQALGLLTIAYTAPILLGGLIAGPLLDRFSPRRVMLADNLLRGVVFALLPILQAIGRLELWHIYLFAAIYGFLMMVSLAGGPTLIPSIVKYEQLDTANALETLSYTVSGVIGPTLSGLLIALLGAANVVIFDALSYFIFAAVLIGLSVPNLQPFTTSQAFSYGIMDAVRLMTGNKVILSTTLMFMAANIGLGALSVFLPLVSDRIAEARSEIFGLLLGIMALGEVISAWLAGSLSLNIGLGKRIALAQALSGMSLAFLFAEPSSFASVAIGLFLLGFFSAPLTIWAQTLRMQVIPPVLRGRTFALLRTLMQGATPLGGALAGFLLPAWGIQMMIGLSSLTIGVPGLAGLHIKELMSAGEKQPTRCGNRANAMQ